MTTTAEAFHDCGEAFIAMMCDECGELNTFDVSCQSKICHKCSGTKAYRTMRRYSRLIDVYENPLRLDLTIENADELRVDDLRELRDKFYNVRDRLESMSYAEKRGVVMAADIPEQKRARYLSSMAQHRGSMEIEGGVYAFETKYTGSSGWNHHIHMVVDAPYIPQPLLSELWRQETGSPVVYIKAVTDKKHLENSLRYILKYMSKPPSIEAEERFDVLDKAVDYVERLKGFRRWGTFGRMYDVSPEDMNGPECEFCGSDRLRYFAHSRTYSDWTVLDEFPEVDPGGAAA
jgi:hypothetical protein